MKKRIMFIIFSILIMFLSAYRGLAEVYAEDFSGALDTDIWTLTDTSGCDIEISGGAIRFNSSWEAPECFYTSTFNLTTNEDVYISFKIRDEVVDAKSVFYVALSSCDTPNDLSGCNGECSFLMRFQDNSPSDQLRPWFNNPDYDDVTLDGINLDTDWHLGVFHIQYGAVLRVNSYIDGVLKDSQLIDSGVCNLREDLHINFGMDGASAEANSYIDYIVVEGEILTNYPEGVTGCAYPDCYGNCIFEDNYNYLCSLDYMGYSVFPSDDDLAPTQYQFFYNNTGLGYWSQIYKPLDSDNFYNTIQETFDFTIYDSNLTYVEHHLYYWDITTLESHNIYKIIWLDNATNTFIYYVDDDIAYEICRDCWSRGVESSYEILHFHGDTYGANFYNVSKSQSQFETSDTFALIIDSNVSKTYFNIPIAQPLKHNNSNRIAGFIFGMHNSAFQLDDYFIHIGGVEYEFLLTIPEEELRGVGDYCIDGSSCITGYCEYHKCALKLKGVSCVYDWECLSGKCVNGYCNDADIVTKLEASVSNQFGGSEEVFNLISLFFMVGVPFAIIMVGRSGVAVMGGIVLYFGLAFGFTFIGWLSPFILIASVIGGLILIVLAFLMGMGGD